MTYLSFPKALGVRRRVMIMSRFSLISSADMGVSRLRISSLWDLSLSLNSFSCCCLILRLIKSISSTGVRSMDWGFNFKCF